MLFIDTPSPSDHRYEMRCFILSKSSAAADFPSTATQPPVESAAAAAPLSASTSEICSQDQTPRSSGPPASPAVLDLTRQYTSAVQTASFQEIWEKIHNQSPSSLVVDHFLRPDRGTIQQALRFARPTNLTGLVSIYFDHSEHTSELCLLLHRSVDSARSIYSRLYDLVEFLPNPSSIATPEQCDWAFDMLSEFDRHENPFPSPDSPTINFHEMRRCFTDLKLQLDSSLRKARRRSRFCSQSASCSTICLTGTAVGIITAVVVATHALAAIVMSPFFAFLPSSFNRQQLNRIAQLDAAARGTYVLNNDLDTIDRLVALLHMTVESDKFLVRLGLQRGKDWYAIQEVVKQLRKNHPNFLHQLKDLEEHVCLCLAAINRARSLLLQEIHLQQTHDPQNNLCSSN